ncbi:hypothetical protein F7984_03070 [Pradoshia sp. D12]|uniref:YgaB family protein n=1 Tax=Bacillaceae TaxID=186817 RepID=UPI00080AF92B|nr:MULTISPECIES: YgaB family protein [Bacillaceae]OCA82484.1 hypothetical protein A8L44_12815 [Bacillus sp. FJAT-27986]QFK70307.1 hypothetical protein F7984_03070 [Pradoshia sp. D12]TPF71088.1 hypothetical protein FHY44_15245 [Bacillus sp. D12]
MKSFEELVNEQMVIMDKLLHMQTELDRYMELEEELRNRKNDEDLLCVQDDISEMKRELDTIQTIFMQLTEKVIESYQSKSAPKL